MTFDEIKGHIVNLTKADVPIGGKLDSLLATAINLSWREIARMRKPDQFIVNRLEVDLTGIDGNNGIVRYTDNDSVIAIKEVRFASGDDEWTLAPEDQNRIPIAEVEGKPRAFRRVGLGLPLDPIDERIYIEPFDQVDENTDRLFITYWRFPLDLASTADTAHIADTGASGSTTMFDTELVDRAAAYIFTFYNKQAQAQLLLAKYQPVSPPQNQA